MELWQLFVDFVENQGIIATVVFVVCYLMYQQQKAHAGDMQRNAVIMQGMIDNQRIESRQQDDILKIMQAAIFNQAQSDQRIGDNTAATTKQSESINTMKDEFQELANAIREMLRRVNEGQANFEEFQRLNKKLAQDMELVLEHVKSLSTQETPVIPPETPKEETPKLAVPSTRTDEQEKTE